MLLLAAIEAKPLQGFMDARRDDGPLDRRLDGQLVADIAYAIEVLEVVDRGGALILPVNISAHGDDTVLDAQVDPIDGYLAVAREALISPAGNDFVGGVAMAGELNGHLIDHGLDAPDHPRRRLGSSFVAEAGDVAAEGDDAVANGDANVTGVDGGIEVELIEHGLLQFMVLAHGEWLPVSATSGLAGGGWMP